MIRGNVRIGDQQWPLTLRASVFRTTNKSMNQVLSVVPGLFEIEPGAEHYPDYQLSLWEFGQAHVAKYAKFEVTKHDEPATRKGRQY